jgi:4'-phosphopantetheinyl transferase
MARLCPRPAAAPPPLRVAALVSLRDFLPLPERPQGRTSTAWCPPPPQRRSAAAAAAPAAAAPDGGAAPPAAALRPGEVHVWWMRPGAPDAAASARCAALLPPDEAAECGDLVADAAARARLAQRAFLRAVLARYCGAPAPALRLARGARGKPALAPPHAGLAFNLTHTDGLVGVAVAAAARVGLDAEPAARRPRADPLRVARRHFAPAEVAALEAASDGARAALFLRLWTLKEAYVKALGHGIGADPPLRGFAFDLGSGELDLDAGADLDFDDAIDGVGSAAAAPPAAAIRFAGGAVAAARGRWSFALLAPTRGHVAAVCLERGAGAPPPAIAAFEADALLETVARVAPRVLARGDCGAQ